MARIFFSYAGNDNECSDGRIEEFYNDLNKQLRQRFADKDGETIFFDKKRLTTGDYWTEEIENELRTCKVFIYIQTEFYFESEWCGREWKFFLNRQEEYFNQNKSTQKSNLMIPIIWTPKCRLPEVTKKIQYSQQSFGEIYEEEGLDYIKKLGVHADEYNRFLHNLIGLLYEKIINCDMPDYTKECKISELASPFLAVKDLRQGIEDKSNSGTKHAQFVYIVGNNTEFKDIKSNISAYGIEGGDWKPFHPEIDEEISIIVQKITSERKLRCIHEDTCDNIGKIIDEAERNNRIVIVIADPWSLNIDKYYRIMEECDRTCRYNFAILISYNDEDTETYENLDRLKGLVVNAFKSKTSTHKNDYFKDDIHTLGQFVNELSATLIHVKNRICAFSDNIRVIPIKTTKRLPVLDMGSND